VLALRQPHGLDRSFIRVAPISEPIRGVISNPGFGFSLRLEARRDVLSPTVWMSCLHTPSSPERELEGQGLEDDPIGRRCHARHYGPLQGPPPASARDSGFVIPGWPLLQAARIKTYPRASYVVAAMVKSARMASKYHVVVNQPNPHSWRWGWEIYRDGQPAFFLINSHAPKNDKPLDFIALACCECCSCASVAERCSDDDAITCLADGGDRVGIGAIAVLLDTTSCYFTSYEQCMTTISGIGGPLWG
jgi:hypothetical protein